MFPFDKLLIYFVAGIISAFLQSTNIRYISKEKALISSGIAFISALVQLSVVIDIISNIRENGFIAVVIYCLGVSVGIYAGTSLRIHKKEIKSLLN